MTTPLIILAILCASTLAFYVFGIWKGKADAYKVGGTIGISMAFIFFAIGHFTVTDKMVMMLPEWLPERVLLIWITGALEFLVGISMLFSFARRYAGYAAITILICFFPANVYAAYNAIDFGGHAWGLSYLWIRTPLQILLIGWCWYFVIQKSKPNGKKNFS